MTPGLYHLREACSGRQKRLIIMEEEGCGNFETPRALLKK